MDNLFTHNKQVNQNTQCLAFHTSTLLFLFFHGVYHNFTIRWQVLWVSLALPNLLQSLHKS